MCQLTKSKLLPVTMTWGILTTYENSCGFIAHPVQFTYAYIKYILAYFVFALACPHFEAAFDTRYSYLAVHWLGHVMVLTAAVPRVHEHSHKQM